MFPMNRKVLEQPVTIEYDCKCKAYCKHPTKRIAKQLDNAFKARSFYAAMFKANRNPKVVKGTL